MIEFSFKSRSMGNLRIRINGHHGVWGASTILGRFVTHLLSADEIHKIDAVAAIMTGRDDLMPTFNESRRAA